MTKEEILQKCRVEGTTVKLPDIQLDRKLYQEVAKALELIGGKWKGGKTMGFVFQTDPTELLQQIANSEVRNLKKEFQFFETPEDLADELVYLADLKQHDSILEPSAGQGAIVRAINKVCDVVPDCYELMDINTMVLSKSGLRFNLIGDDFLKHEGKTYSKIIANPPFSKNQDIYHIMKMYECLSRFGRLVTVASKSWMTGGQKKQQDFRKWLDSVGAEVEEIEPGRFRESGTMVASVIITINKEDSQNSTDPKGSSKKSVKAKEVRETVYERLPHPQILLDEMIEYHKRQIERCIEMKTSLPPYIKETEQEVYEPAKF